MTRKTTMTNNRCVFCGRADVVPAGVRDVPHDVRGIVMRDLKVYRCPSCGEEEIEYPRLGELHDRIALELATRPGRLMGAELRFLRTHVGWSTAAEFARVVGTHASTVSKWETDVQQMDLRAEMLLRVLAVRERAGSMELELLEALLSRPQLDPVERPELHLSFVGGRWEAVSAMPELERAHG
jgi:putative zinc finger/helix-turn-helix YgiT family protein